MLSLVTGSTELALSLADAKNHLGIDQSFDDSRVTDLIRSAQDFIERERAIDLVPKTWDYSLCSFPFGPIDLPRQPVTSITSISYYTGLETSTTYASSSYLLQSPWSLRARVYNKATSWPVAYWGRPDAVTVRFVSGSTVENYTAKHALRLLVGHWNENREAEIAGTISSEIKIGLDRLLNQL